MFKHTLVTGVLAALQVVSARDTYTTSDAIRDRVDPGSTESRLCYPEGKWTLGKDTIIPPCISEQIVSRECEDRTGALRALDDQVKTNAYRDCLVKGSYKRDVFGCLACKEKNRIHSPGEHDFWKNGFTKAFDAFEESDRLNQGFWHFVEINVDFGQYPADTKGTRDKDYTVQDYYLDPPRPQNVGNFSLDPPLAGTPRLHARRAADSGAVTVKYHKKEGSLVGIDVVVDAELVARVHSFSPL